MHLVTEILKAACADREYRYGDPLFVDVGLDELLSDAHVERAGRRDRHAARHARHAAAGRALSGELRRRSAVDARGATPSSSPTPPTAAPIDRWGNAMSATPSDGSWRSPVIPGLGIVPSGRGTQSRPDPNHPSGVAPGKRPRLTPNPAIAVRDDGSVIPFGAPGGDVQVQAMLQVFLNAFHFGMDIQEAIEQPRFATFSFPNSFAPYTHLPGPAEHRGPAAGGDDRGAPAARPRRRDVARADAAGLLGRGDPARQQDGFPARRRRLAAAGLRHRRVITAGGRRRSANRGRRSGRPVWPAPLRRGFGTAQRSAFIAAR